MSIKYIENYNASLEDIENFEQLIRTKLPESYKQFLLENGGGVLEGAVSFKIVDPDNLDDNNLTINEGLEYISAFNPEETLDLRTHYKYMSSEDREFPYIPKEMIVIGGSGGSCLLLGIKDNYMGKVFFWHSELFHGDENANETFDNISFVAENFDDFLSSLEIEEEA